MNKKWYQINNLYRKYKQIRKIYYKIYAIELNEPKNWDGDGDRDRAGRPEC